MIGFSLGLAAPYAQGAVGMPTSDPLEIEVLGDGTLEITVGNGLLDIVISGSPYHDGTYQLDPALLETGPANLAPPQWVEAEIDAEEATTLTPGLWLFSQQYGTPSLVRSVNGAGMLTGLGYQSVVADGGLGLTITETAMQGTQSRSATSNVLTVVANFDPSALGTKLVGWWDTSDTALLWQDTAATLPATQVGDTVNRIDDKSGNGNHLVTGGAFPSAGTLAADAVDWDGGKYIIAALSAQDTDMEIHAVVENEGDAPFILCNTETDVGRFLGVVQPGSGSPAQSGYSGLIYAADGTDVAFGSRQDAFSSWGTGRIVASARNVDWSGSRGENLIVLGYRNSGTFRFFGKARQIVITRALTVAERTDLSNWMLERAV